MKKNEVYRFLNWKGCKMEDKNQLLFKAYIEEMISPFGGSCSVSSDTSSNPYYISFKITFPNYSNKYAEIRFPFSDSPGQGKIVFNGTHFNSVYEYFGNFASNTPNGGCLIVPMDNGGVISVPTVYLKTENIPCLSTYANYLIFTWAQDIRTQEKFPCILYEYTSNSYNTVPRKCIRGLLFQDNNSNFDDYFSLEIQNRQTVGGSSTANNFTEKYPYPVLSQMTIPFDQYIFPDLFKKETGAECDFGAVLIQKKKYFLTNHFAFKMTE